MSRSPHLLARILKVYTEALTEFSHIYYPDGLNPHYCLKAVSSGNFSNGEGKQNIHCKDREGNRSLIAQVQLTGQPPVLSMTFTNNYKDKLEL